MKRIKNALLPAVVLLGWFLVNLFAWSQVASGLY